MRDFRDSALVGALHCDHPAADRADMVGLYAWMVGDWEMDSIYHLSDGSTRKGHGEIHSGWVLQGRAIQDVWRIPGKNQSGPDDPAKSLMYGTTLRAYDPGINAWHIVWSDPVRQYYSRQIGRPRGEDIVQEGTDADGTQVRWTFTERTADSFHWLGERSSDGGNSWRLEVEFLVRRVAKRQMKSGE
jgi:hypothetical protein